MTLNEELLVVKQADREAAADNTQSRSTAAMMRRGDADTHPHVQAFARHRTRHEEALRALTDALTKHHQWNAAQTDPDPEHGFIPADEYADSSLYEITVRAIGLANPLLTDGPVNASLLADKEQG